MPHALNIRDIGDNLNAALDARAAEEGVSKSELVRRILAEAVQLPRRRLGAGRGFVNDEMRIALERMQADPGSETAWRGVDGAGVDLLAESREE